jgi:hypothetical protein
MSGPGIKFLKTGFREAPETGGFGASLSLKTTDTAEDPAIELFNNFSFYSTSAKKQQKTWILLRNPRVLGDLFKKQQGY